MLRDLVFYLLLPILIFEASINMHIRALRREVVLIGALAIPLLLIATWIAAWFVLVLMGSAFDNNLALALLIGAMICATDPTAITGVVTGTGIKNRVVLDFLRYRVEEFTTCFDSLSD